MLKSFIVFDLPSSAPNRRTTGEGHEAISPSSIKRTAQKIDANNSPARGFVNFHGFGRRHPRGMKADTNFPAPKKARKTKNNV
jgi:hypothetical protein